MSVYVDNMQAGYRRMVMCHMIADTTEELLAMADKIGVARKWIQKPGTHQEHFDICKSKRVLAVKHGAVEITQRELGQKLVARRSESPRGFISAPTLDQLKATPREQDLLSHLWNWQEQSARSKIVLGVPLKEQ